jgi:hypothetical protein
MGHSVISLADRHVLMHDAEIIATVAYILHFAQTRHDRFPEADHPWLTAWRDALACYFTGCIDLQLDETLTSPQAIARFQALATAARAALATEPEMFPGERLNAMTGMVEDGAGRRRHTGPRGFGSGQRVRRAAATTQAHVRWSAQVARAAWALTPERPLRRL